MGRNSSPEKSSPQKSSRFVSKVGPATGVRRKLGRNPEAGKYVDHVMKKYCQPVFVVPFGHVTSISVVGFHVEVTFAHIPPTYLYTYVDTCIDTQDTRVYQVQGTLNYGTIQNLRYLNIWYLNLWYHRLKYHTKSKVP